MCGVGQSTAAEGGGRRGGDGWRRPEKDRPDTPGGSAGTVFFSTLGGEEMCIRQMSEGRPAQQTLTLVWETDSSPQMLPTPVVPTPDYSRVYEPAEDSFLFLDLFEQLHDAGHFARTSSTASRQPGELRVVVELGAGSGVVSTFIAANRIIPNAFHIATDINATALETTRNTFAHNCGAGAPAEAPFDVLRASLTDAFRPHEIDVLLFNPPYVPSEEIPPVPSVQDDASDSWLDLALVGGHDGMLVTGQVLASLNSVLAPQGEAYILFCARNNHPQVVQRFRQKNPNFSVDCVIARKCGWEELAIYRFTKLS